MKTFRPNSTSSNDSNNWDASISDSADDLSLPRVDDLLKIDPTEALDAYFFNMDEPSASNSTFLQVKSEPFDIVEEVIFSRRTSTNTTSSSEKPKFCVICGEETKCYHYGKLLRI